MPFPAQCPGCDRTFNFPESERFRRARCPGCDTEFIAGESPPAPAATSAGAAGEPGGAAAARAVTATAPCPAGRAPAGRSVTRRVAAYLLLFVVAGVCLVRITSRPPAAEEPAEPVQGGDGELLPEVAEAVALARELNNGKVPEELEKVLAQGRGSGGDFPPPPPSPAADPADLDHALVFLRDPFWLRRKTAAAWIARQPVDPARRAEVNHALLEMLRAPEALQHAAAADALLTWADADARTELIELAGREELAGAPAALMLLARLKDERAAPLAARQLGHFFKRRQAAKVLETLGPAAEKEVAAALGQGDAATRLEACRVLGRIGTAASVPALEAAEQDGALAETARQAIQAIQARGRR